MIEPNSYRRAFMALLAGIVFIGISLYAESNPKDVSTLAGIIGLALFMWALIEFCYQLYTEYFGG